MGSFTCRDDARPAADDPTARDADSRRWQEVRRAVQEAKQLGGIYSMKIRGVTIVLKQDKSQRSSKASADDQPVRKELTARQMRSKERKDAFHAKKRGESARRAHFCVLAAVISLCRREASERREADHTTQRGTGRREARADR